MVSNNIFRPFHKRMQTTLGVTEDEEEIEYFEPQNDHLYIIYTLLNKLVNLRLKFR